jgi:hypothetical protein
MPALEVRDVKRALLRKLQAEEDTDRADPYYVVRDDDGRVIGTTSISHGEKGTLGDKRIAKMAGYGQLNLDTAQQFADLVHCPLSREAALAIMRRNWPPGSSRLLRR